MAIRCKTQQEAVGTTMNITALRNTIFQLFILLVRVHDTKEKQNNWG